mgnify:CR=1 FL=1
MGNLKGGVGSATLGSFRRQTCGMAVKAAAGDNFVAASFGKFAGHVEICLDAAVDEDEVYPSAAYSIVRQVGCKPWVGRYASRGKREGFRQGFGGGEERTYTAAGSAFHAVPAYVVVDACAVTRHTVALVSCMSVVGRP